MRKDLLLFLVCTLLGMILLFSYHKPPTEIEAPGRIVLLGIDGLSWDPIFRPLQQGQLPHLARLMQQGSYGDLKTDYPDRSSHVWATVATGVKKDKHMIIGRVERLASGNKIIGSLDWRFPAVWNYLSERGLPVMVVGWPVNWPSLPVKGINISDMFFPPWGDFSAETLQSFKRRSYPQPLGATLTNSDLEGLLLELGKRYEPLVRANHGTDTHWQFMLSDLKTAMTALYHFRKYDPLVSFIYLGGFHPFMKSLCSRTTRVKGGSEPKEYDHYEIIDENVPLIETYLCFLDELIGYFQAPMVSNDTMMIVSASGIVPGSIDQVINDPDISLPLGLFVFQGPFIKDFNRPVLGGSIEITPTILYLLDQPLIVNIDGGVMMLAIKEVLSFHRKVRFTHHPVKDFQPATILMAEQLMP